MVITKRGHNESDEDNISRNGGHTADSWISRLFYSLLFGIASTSLVLLAPGWLTGTELALLDKHQILAFGLLTASFLLALLTQVLPLVFRLSIHRGYILFATALAFAACFFLLFEYQNRSISNFVLATVLLSVFFLLLFHFGKLVPYFTLIGVIGAATALAWTTDFSGVLQRATGTLSTTTNASTVFYNLQIRTFPGRIPPSIKGGGLALFGDGYLLATGDGRLYVVEHSIATDMLEIRRLPIEVPLNSAEFARDASSKVDKNKFRVTDVHTQARGNELRVFVAHHSWKSADGCFVLQVSAIDFKSVDIESAEHDREWQTIYETSPCLPFKNSGHPFAGHQAGGRMDMRDDGTLVLAVGDYEFDGHMSEQILPQDANAHYGKTILIDVDSRASSILSSGHRNPQGLHVHRNGTIWLAEHGPQGGDELNIVLPDTNYGWPLETYGTAYGRLDWPLSQDQGKHPTYESPAYAWMPGIGISNLISIESDYLERWKSDLVVASLNGNSLFRIRVEGNSVRYFEEIPIGKKRIRDIIEGHDGQLILWTDDSSIITVTKPEKNSTGQQLFSVCSGCHRIGDGSDHGIGPDLYRIRGRRVGAADGFQYSEALTRINTKWNRDSLDAFLADPQHFAPGTTMIFPGVKDTDERRKLVEYLLKDGR